MIGLVFFNGSLNSFYAQPSLASGFSRAPSRGQTPACYSGVEMVSYRSDQTYRATCHGSHKQGSPRRPYSPVLTNTQGTKGRDIFCHYTQPDYYGPQVSLAQPTAWAGKLIGTPEPKMPPAEGACPQLDTAHPGHTLPAVERKK